MTSPDPVPGPVPVLVEDCTVLQAGDRIDVHLAGDLYYRGLVEETMPLLHVVWARELGTGERRMFSTDENRIFQQPPPATPGKL
ncbi:hypothetical protein QYM41_09580 [Kocuria sp. CPCC 205268]|uniref:Uncharacterized protein n=1 Tax=Kocuria rosea subsp. polaris TaxID=136273 RepID=A0A0W8IPN5_KOCRO|nr:hypothetical protein [Kocuria polaris]KUG61850.1 hypothetical protein AVL61_10980 [Kocuria polaris]